MNNNVILIHIGKCGGTTIHKLFGLKQYHLVKPIYTKNTKYVIWIRNPLSRFVSAFNMSYTLINLDTTKLNINELNTDNCIAPARTKYKMTHDHTFSKEYDFLINYFKTANNLAESLTSTDLEIRTKAEKLMRHNMEHINRGIGWYLDNGDFIEKYHSNILMCGKIETMEQDIQRLSVLLGKDVSNKNHHYRQNRSQNKYLSELAINNLLSFYKDTDYKALNVLHKYEYIDTETLASYSKYSY